MNKVQLGILLRKAHEEHCGPKCKKSEKRGELCTLSYVIRTERFPPISKCKIAAIVFRHKHNLDNLFEKEKHFVANLQYAKELRCATCANVMCARYKEWTDLTKKEVGCKYWMPQVLLDYPSPSARVSLEGITTHPQKVGQIGYSFGGQLSNPTKMTISLSVGTYSRKMTGGTFAYIFDTKVITTRPYFYTLEEFGYKIEGGIL